MPSGYPDYEGNKVGLYEKPAWAAFEGKDKNFYGVVANQPPGGFILVTYLVPAGKTLFITSLSFMAAGGAIEDRDNNQMCEGIITDSVDGNQIRMGANGGGGIDISKPIEIIAGRIVTIWTVNNANHNCNLTVTAQGYEI